MAQAEFLQILCNDRNAYVLCHRTTCDEHDVLDRHINPSHAVEHAAGERKEVSPLLQRCDDCSYDKHCRLYLCGVDSNV